MVHPMYRMVEWVVGGLTLTVDVGFPIWLVGLFYGELLCAG
jgi:hypothetical protein